jgi:hypothetical protein
MQPTASGRRGRGTMRAHEHEKPVRSRFVDLPWQDPRRLQVQRRTIGSKPPSG